ncbi:hypothetical protein BD408DRAFT_438490 [Parasitella parasitica]|nr:hypothetical protein BD408DRAFT_438490 [Parasitella parasitica]
MVCVHHDMEESRAVICKSTLELNFSGASEDPVRTNSVHSSRNLVLTECHLFSHGESSTSLPSSHSGQPSGSNDLSNDNTSLTTEQLDALRLEVIRNRINALGLNPTATQDLFHQHLHPSATIKCYKKHQLRFLDFACLQQNTLINFYLDALAKLDPPTLIHRLTIDVSPALVFACSIASRPTTSVKLLQEKLAFLLAMAAFLRPSDLTRIPFEFAKFRILIVCSFRWWLQKKLGVKGASSNHLRFIPMRRMSNCAPFNASRHSGIIQDYKLAQPIPCSFYQVQQYVNQSLTSSTISTWLHRNFISLCTNEPGVSIRSLASSRALDLGVSLDSITALGNWASSETFVRHYQ